ncbi:MAG TPA: YggT family protein [Anaerolineaceae bacterium]|nr:YggT family protein [Chloroflexota bacterium]HNY83863.1 YggT family protein [Anaerolineaceae bacterium]
MIASILISMINLLGMILTVMVMLYVLLGYFVAPDKPIMVILSRVVEPLLKPIRKTVKPIGGLDIAPLVLILSIYALEWILTRVISSFAI